MGVEFDGLETPINKSTLIKILVSTYFTLIIYLYP